TRGRESESRDMTTARRSPVVSTGMNPKLDALRTADGRFAMVALDQRESLREMFPPRADGSLASDAELSDFKAATIAALTPFASGILLDRELGMPHGARPAGLAPGCGLLLAAD